MTRTFGTQMEAKFWLSQQETALVQDALQDPRAGDVLFERWVEEWLRTRAMLKPATQAADRSRLPTLHHEFDGLTLRQITPTLIRQWVATLSVESAPKTVRHYHALLHSILALAVDEGSIRQNPCVGTTLPESLPQEHVYLTEVEAAALIAAHPEHWRPVPILLLGTGLRWAEAVGLRCRYVDLNRRELTVRHTWSDRYGWQTPKTAMSRRTIGIGSRVIDALAPLMVGQLPDTPVLRAKQGGMVRHGAYRDRVWLPAVKEAGLEAKAPTPHSLRHTHVAWLIAAGVPLPAIQRRLGHKSIAVTSDIYGGLLPRVDETLVAAVDLAMGDRVPDVVPESL